MEAVDEIEDEHVEYEEVSTDGEVASQGSGDDLLADGDDESVTLVEPSLAVFIIDRSLPVRPSVCLRLCQSTCLSTCL